MIQQRDTHGDRDQLPHDAPRGAGKGYDEKRRENQIRQRLEVQQAKA